MQRLRSEEGIGLALILASAAAFSTAGLFTRAIDLDVWTVLFWRGLFGGLALLAMLGWLQGRRLFANLVKSGWPGLVVALCSAVATLCFVPALRLTSVADVLIIFATVPFLTAGLAWAWTGERQSRATLVASLVALAGMVVMVAGNARAGLHPAGAGLALIAAALFAVMMVVIRRHRQVSMLPAACLSGFLAMAMAAPLAQPAAAGAAQLAWLAAFGVVQFALGLVLLTLGTQRVSATRAALVGLLETPLAPLWVWFSHGEAPWPATWIGGGIVMAAVVADVLAGRGKGGGVEGERAT